MIYAIDRINQRLGELVAAYRLDDNADKLDANYSLYIAKKKGIPKDDFPGLALMSNVKKINYQRFSLGCFSTAFVSPID